MYNILTLTKHIYLIRAIVESLCKVLITFYKVKLRAAVAVSLNDSLHGGLYVPDSIDTYSK